MSELPLVQTVIPSRLGSTRVPLKGLRIVGGKTLLEHCVGAVKASRHLGRHVWVNSDSDLMGRVAAECGVRFYKRRPELATSASPIDEYLYDFMCAQPSQYLAVVTPTSPLLSARDLDAAWEAFTLNGCRTLITAERIQTHCFFNGKPLNHPVTNPLVRSQDITPVLALNFTIAIYDCQRFRESFEERGYGVWAELPHLHLLEGPATIDIDEEHDLHLAELELRAAAEGAPQAPRFSEHARELLESGIDSRT